MKVTPDLRIVTPDRLACSSGMTSMDENEHARNVDRGLNSQAGASLRIFFEWRKELDVF